jgi:hypothetical protein
MSLNNNNKNYSDSISVIVLSSFLNGMCSTIIFSDGNLFIRILQGFQLLLAVLIVMTAWSCVKGYWKKTKWLKIILVLDVMITSTLIAIGLMTNRLGDVMTVAQITLVKITSLTLQILVIKEIIIKHDHEISLI